MNAMEKDSSTHAIIFKLGYNEFGDSLCMAVGIGQYVVNDCRDREISSTAQSGSGDLSHSAIGIGKYVVMTVGIGRFLLPHNREIPPTAPSGLGSMS